MGGIVVIAGVPGTGKSLLGSRLAMLLGYKFTTVSWLVFKHGLWVEYDPTRRSFVIDEDALKSLLKGLSRHVVETHWLEVFDEAKVEYIVVTRCHPLVLAERLKLRNWPRRKIAENVEAELVGVIAREALEFVKRGVPVYEVDTTSVKPDKLVREVLEAYRSGLSRCCIDWLSLLEERELEKIITEVSQLETGV